MRAKPRRLASLAGRHAGEDIWVVGGGPSVDFVPAGFFAGRVTICVNYAFQLVSATYCCTTVAGPLRRARASGAPWIVPDRERGCRPGRMTTREGVKWLVGRAVRVETPGDVQAARLGADDLIVGPTSALTAIHAAAILGARAVFVVGMDGGSLDGRWRAREYRAGFYADCEPGGRKPPEKATGDRVNVPLWLATARALRDRLASDYGCNVVGFNPFLGLDCDGHAFRPA